MKNKFIYPTLKNSIALLLFLQIIPIAIGLVFDIYKLSFWFEFEMVIIGIILNWQLKPVKEFDERELAINLKWKNRMFEFTYPCLIIPIVSLALYPELAGWNVLMFFAVPVFIILCVLSVLLKKELGGFFYQNETNEV